MNWFIHSVSPWAFSSQSWRYHKSQARELQFLRECSPPTTCHMSWATCHVLCVACLMSHVMCHMSQFLFLSFLTKWWNLSVEGLLLTGPTPPSFSMYHIIEDTGYTGWGVVQAMVWCAEGWKLWYALWSVVLCYEVLFSVGYCSAEMCSVLLCTMWLHILD